MSSSINIGFRILILSFTLNSSIIHYLRSETILVPAEFPTIQAGIDAGRNGDTVMVAPGTYRGEGNFNIDFRGKALLVTSQNGAEVTIIEVDSMGRGFVFQNEEDSNSVLIGFSIRNGYILGENYGGGIYCVQTSPTIKYNIIQDCFAYYGGGIAIIGGDPVIRANTFADNTAERGGGVFCGFGSSAVMDSNIIISNFSQGG